MSERKRKKKPKQKLMRQRKQSDPGSKAKFDQLLDDAIFGVKKKNPRG